MGRTVAQTNPHGGMAMPNIAGGNESGKEISRRNVLIGGAALIAAALPAVTFAANAKDKASTTLSRTQKKREPASFITTKDGVQIYLQGLGQGSAHGVQPRLAAVGR